jgi:hypothetical protein
MWKKMRTLEGKYIDLANFYKKELHNSSSDIRNGSDVGMPLQNAGASTTGASSKSAVGGVVIQPHMEGYSSNRNPSDDFSEDTILHELKNEKLRFESNIKSMIGN